MHFLVLLLFFTSFISHQLHARTLVESQANSSYSNQHDDFTSVRPAQSLDVFLAQATNIQRSAPVYLNEQIYTCGCIDVQSPLQLVGAKNSQLISPIDVVPQEMFQVSNTTLIIESATLMPNKEVARAVNSIIHLDFVTIASYTSESLVISLNSHVTLCSIDFKHPKSHPGMVSLVRSEGNSGSMILASSSLNNGILRSSEPLVASSCTPSTQIAWSSFSNISVPTNVNTRPLINTVGKTRMVGCRTESVHSVHDGTITSPINGPGSFLFTNNSFANTDRSNAIYTYPEGAHTSQIFPSEDDVLFHNCHFKNCVSSECWGGAIFSQQEGQKVTITHSSFTSCSCTMVNGAGGAVSLNSTITSVSNCTFTDCHCYAAGACALLPYQFSNSFCDNKCYSCTADREPVFTSDFSTTTLTLSGNYFESNEVSERACVAVCIHEAEISHNYFKGNTHTHPEKCRSTLEVFTDTPKSLSMYANKFEENTFTATTCNGTISSDIGFIYWRQTEQVLFPAVNPEQIFFPSSAQSDTPITPLETANVIVYGLVNEDQSFKETYKADTDSPSPYVQFSRPTTLFLSQRKYDFSTKAISFGAFSGNAKVIIENIQITPNTTALSTDFVSLSTASLIVDKITLDSLPVGSYSFIRMTGESSLVVSQSTFSNFAQTSGAGGSFLVMDGSATQHTTLSTTMFTSLSSTGNGGVVLATLTTESTLTVDTCEFSSCSSGGNGGVMSVSCAAGVPSSSLVIKLLFAEPCTCGSGQKGDWVFVEGSSFLTLLDKENWLMTLSSLATPTDDNLLWGTDMSEPETSKYRSMTLLYYLLPFRHVTIHSSSEGRDEDGCGRSEWECKSLEVGASHLSGAGSHKLIVVASTTLTTPLSFSTNAIEICPKDTTVSITTGSAGKLTVSVLTLTLTSISFDGQSVERSSSLLEITGSGWIVVSGCSFSSFVKVGDGSIFSSSLNSGNSLTFDNTNFSSCSSSGRGGALAVSLNGGSFSMVAPIRFEFCSSNLNEGHWISITSADLVTFLSSSLAPLKPAAQTSLYSTEEKKKWFGVDRLTSSEGSLLFYWYPHTSSSGAVHVRKDGEDHVLCGVTELPCSLLSSSFSKSHSTATVIDSDLEFNEVISTITSPHSLSSTISNEITVDTAASFVVSSSSLSVQTCSFVSKGTQRTLSLLTLSGSGSARLTSCKFSLFSSTVGGSVVSGTIKTGSSLVVDGCSFTSCVSKWKGGVISVSLDGTGTIETKNTNTFETCSSETGEGNWISITSADLVSFLSTDALTSIRPNSTNNALFGNEEKKKYFGVDTLTSSEGSLLFYWYPHTSAEESTHIHADGEDHALCGRESLPCSSFNRTLSQGNKNNTYLVDSAMTLKEGLTIASDTILTSSTSQQTITTTSAAYIAIDQKSLTLLDLSLTGSSRASPFLSLSSSGTLILKSCSFSSFSNTQRDGSVLSAVLGSATKLEISDCSFEKCKSAGNGGVISVDLCDLTNPPNLVLSSLSFGESGTDEANLCGEGKLGQNIYVVSLPTQRPTLKTIFASVLPSTPANGATFFSSSEMNRMEFGEKSSDVVSGIGSLLFVVFSYDGGDLTVDESSSITHSLCGHSFLPCSSLSVGYSFVKKLGETDGRLLVRGGVSLDAIITTIDKAASITSTSKVETVSVGSGKYFWIRGGSLTVSSLAFVNASESFDQSLFVLSGTGSLSLSDCSFTGFSSSVKGSVISGDVGGGLEVSECSFVSCSSNQNEGAWISITSVDLVTFLASSLASLKPAAQTSPYSSLEKKKWFGVDRLTSSEGSLLFYWYPHTSAEESTHIHADGDDHALCGRESLPCSSFNKTLSHPNANNTFVVDSAMTLKEGLTIVADTILTSSTSQQSITTTSASSIAIDQQSLTLLDLSLIGSSRTSSFISLSSASSVLVVNDCLFSSFSLPMALIDFTAGSLSLTSTKFHQIARTDGNGSVLEVEVVEGMELKIDDVELCDVTTQNGVANGFFISFTTISDKSKIPAFSLRNLKYSSSSSSNSNRAFVWVEGNNLDEWIAYGDPRFTGSFENGVSFEWLWSVDHATTLKASLLFYLIAGSGAIGVASDGLDLAKCGHNSVWCRTLEHSLTRALTVLTNQLHVMREVSVQNSVEMGGVTVKGLPVMSSIVLSSSGCLREETGDTVQFESVTVVLKEGGRSSAALVVLFGHMNLSMVEISVLADQTTPLFKSVDSILTLQTITISSSHNVGTLMDCEKGTLSVNSLVIANISFASTPICLSDLRSATLVQLQVSNTSDVVFMECSNISKLSLQSSSFEGAKQATLNDEEQESLCEWTTGLISISDSTVSVDQIRFTHLSQGALFLSNATTSIYLTSFSNNIVGSSEFPSARKNIRCEGGELVVDSLNGGDGSKDLPSAWISLDSECLFSSPVIEPSAVLFVPTLTSTESPASFSKASQLYTLTLTGSLLMDCNLSLEVFSVDEKNVEKGSIPIPLSTSNTMNWTESSFSTQLASSALSSLNSKMEWRCRIVFGDGFATDSTLVKRSASDERKAQFASVRKWLIPVIIASSVLLLLFFIILIIILVRRRNKQKKGQEQQKARTEMDEQLPVEKFDGDESFAPTLVNTTANLQKVNQNEFDEGAGPAPDTQPHGMERGKPVENEGKFEAVNLSDVSEKVVVNWKDTLYRRLHSGENRMIGAERATIAQQLARGLLNLAQKDASSLGLRNVSPHWIVFDWTNQMYLQTGEVKKGESVLGSVTRNTKEDSAGVEGQRWIAPELMDSESNKKHDHGAVFSLGLILWELETGAVPFGELDAANAHRQLGCGGQLSMTKISSPKLVSLIEKCLDLDPTGRPTLAEVSKELGEDGLFASGTILQDDPLGCDF